MKHIKTLGRMEFQICMEFRIQSGSVVKIEVLCMQF